MHFDGISYQNRCQLLVISKYLPVEEEEEDTKNKNDGVTNPINIATTAIELDEIKESPTHSQQHAQTSV